MKKVTKQMTVAVMAAIMVFAAQVAQAGPKGDSLVDVAVAVNSEGAYAGYFDTLIAGIVAADPAILAVLDGNGQHTVFAPTDAAFADVGLNEVNIATMDQGVLTEILLYHVVRGRRLAEDVLSSDQLRTRLGDFVQQTDGVLIDNLGFESTIIVTNVKAANGVIHVIDSVLLPFAP